MLAISAWCAIRDAISCLAKPDSQIELDAPATPENIMNAIGKLRE